MIRSPLVAVALVLTCCSFLSAKPPLSPKSQETCLDGKRPYRLGVRHIESGGIGYTSGYTTFEAFLAGLDSWEVSPFLDARGHVFDDGKWAANAGVGVRAILDERVYGINTYYDYRNSSHYQSSQIGVGLETLGELFDFRINGYFPFGKKIGPGYDAFFTGFDGNYLLVSNKHRFSMTGADAEFGFHFGKSENIDFYAAAGPYYFIGKIGGGAWGGKARLSGVYKDTFSVEISDSYDGTFHNKFQGQIGFSFSLGPKSKVKKEGASESCKFATALNARLVQPVGRQEIIVMNKKRRTEPAIDPATGEPYLFLFVNNMSSSDGTYESPYHSFAQVQAVSAPNDIVYVFPGDGTTTGMDAGILLKDNQKLWGSGVAHSLQTSTGTVNIPSQTSTSPVITNTDVDTEGNAVTLAANNSVSGFTVTSTLNDGIYGASSQSLAVSFCTFEDITTFPIETSFAGSASVSITNSQFSTNVNGISLSLDGTSDLVFSNNTFEDQTSVSNVPIEINSESNILTLLIENNIFNNNTTGSVRLSLINIIDADISVLNNTMTNNGTGSQSSLGSNVVVISTGTNDQCSIRLSENTFSQNDSNTLYLHTSGAFTNLEVTASTNSMTNNGGSALVLATPVDDLTLLINGNTISDLNDNAIGVIDNTHITTTGSITITDNSITTINNSSNAIAVNQDFTTLTLTIQDNEINGCEGTGIISYAPTGIASLSLSVSGNTIDNCQNMSSNAASGLDIEQYVNLAGSVTDNTLSNNTGNSFYIGSTLTAPSVCLTLTGNNSDDYHLVNPMDGIFNLSPCNVEDVNVGMLDAPDVDIVISCPDATPCTP